MGSGTATPTKLYVPGVSRAIMWTVLVKKIYSHALLSVAWHLASRPSHLPSTAPCPAMTRPRASRRRCQCSRLWPHEAPRGRSRPHRCGTLLNLPVTAEGCLKEASRTPGALPPRRIPRQPTLRAFRPLRRALLSARGGLFIAPPLSGGIGSRQQKQRLRAPRRAFLSFLDPTPKCGGG